MSVIKARRHQSSAHYVNVADDIVVETMWFCTRLSNRFSRSLGDPTIKIAYNILDNAEAANNIRVTDQLTYDIRRSHLIEAKTYVPVLDVRLTHIFNLIQQNPEGAFTNSHGKTKTDEEARKELDKHADKLSEYIDKEKALLQKVLDSDKKAFEKKQQENKQ